MTVLIGLTIKNKSRVGIVHSPFSVEDREVGKTIFGSAEHGVFKVTATKDSSVSENLQRSIEYLEPFEVAEPAEDHPIKVAASINHFSETMKEIIGTLGEHEVVRIGGAGNKVCNLALGTVDCYLHPSKGLMHWDLAAPESLVKGMGGKATNFFQEPLSYPLDAPSYMFKGLICAKHPPMYNMIKTRMGQTLTDIASKVKF